jgi:hypothetical protein
VPTGGVAAGPAGVVAVDGFGVHGGSLANGVTKGCGVAQLGLVLAAVVGLGTDDLYEEYLVAISL